MASMINEYLNQVWAELPPSMARGQRMRIVHEIEDHLLESWDGERERGLPAEDALRIALERFGSPVAIAQEFAELDAVRKRQTVRSCLFGGLLAFLLLVVYSLLRYPAVSGTPAMQVIYSVLCGSIVCLYGWAGIRGTQFATPVEAAGPWQGMKASLFLALLIPCASVASNLLAIALWGAGASLFPNQSLVSINQMINALAAGVPLLAWLAMTAWCSTSVAYDTGRIDIGTRVGFWSGLMTGLVVAVTSLLMSYIHLLSYTSWLHDTTCMGSHDLVACEMGDTLGGIATTVLLLPLIGAALGVFAGFIGRESRLAQLSVQVPTASIAISRQEARIGFPVIFCCITFALFLLGIFTHLW